MLGEMRQGLARGIVRVHELPCVNVMNVGLKTDEERYWTEFAVERIMGDGEVYGWNGKRRETFDLDDVALAAAEQGYEGDNPCESERFVTYYASRICKQVRDWYTMEQGD